MAPSGKLRREGGAKIALWSTARKGQSCYVHGVVAGARRKDSAPTFSDGAGNEYVKNASGWKRAGVPRVYATYPK